jgi:DNA (cytosine-5)-methyltransferase 1
MPSKPTLVSSFAGCGGSSLGYQEAGFDVRLAIENDSQAAAAYRRNFPDTTIFDGDIAKLSGAQALKMANVAAGDLDVLDGSPPCQGFSTAGQRQVMDRRNRLFEEYVRLLEALAPKAFIMENVTGLRKGKMKLMFAEITRALKACGYQVACRELNAAWYGVPQDRRRLIWVGIRRDIMIMPSHPDPTTRIPVSVNRAFGNAIQRKPRVQVIAHDDGRHPEKRKSGHQSGTSLRAACKPRVQVLAAIRPQSINDGVETRCITIDEAKILQGFPATFQLDAKDYRLIGNSVCPPMAQAVGTHVLKLLQDG